MDAVLGLGNFVKDIMDAENDLSKFADKLKLALYRFSRIYEEMYIVISEEFEIFNYKKLLDEGKYLLKDTEERLKNLGITGKITMSLPFDKTKSNLKNCIEEMEKATAQLRDKQHKLGLIETARKIDKSEDNKDGFSQIKVIEKKQSRIQQKKESKYSMRQSVVRRIDSKEIIEKEQQEEEVIEQVRFNPTLIEQEDSPYMMPTLVEKYHQNNDWLEISIDLIGNGDIMKLIKTKNSKSSVKNLLKTFSRFQSSTKMQPKKFFKPIYDKVIQKYKQIDFISSKTNHFELQFICSPSKKEEKKEVIEEPNVQDILIDTIKQSLQCVHSSFRSEQFLSFPPDKYQIQNYENMMADQKLILINKSQRGTFIKRQGFKNWICVTGKQEVRNGDLICPIMKFPQKKQPIIVFQVTIEKIFL